MRKVMLLLGFLLTATTTYAQADCGALAGTVRDSSGLVVPGATIEATQNNTGRQRMAATSGSGTFDIPDLSLGVYTVKVSGKGLQTITVENLLVSVGHTTIFNVILRASGPTERLEVTDSEQQLDETSDALGGRVERKQVSELLLNGRNWATLTTLAPLAVDSNYGSASNQRTIRVSGRGRDDNNFTYDGVDATNIINQAQLPYVRLAVPLDTIQEFRVVSMLATAESGATAGAQMSVVSAGGSSQSHGDLFDFVRNDAFDSRSFIDPVKPPFHLNQFGASIGGPLRQKKTFFYLAYEGYRQRLGQTLIGFVPSETFRQQVSARTPVLSSVLNAYPDGTQAVPGDPDVSEYVAQGYQLADEDSGMIRIDHRFSDSLAVFARLNVDRAQSSAPLASSGEYLKDRQELDSSPVNAAIGLTHVVSPTLVNEAKFGFNRSTAYSTSQNQTGALYSFVVPGFTTMNNRRISIGAANTFAGIDNLTKIAGKHVLKAGAEIRRIQMNQGRTANGSVSFSSLSAFAADHVNSATFAEALPVNGLRKFTYFSYIQDEFRWTTSLTLNLGVRYSFFNVFHEVDERPNPFDFATCGPGGFCGTGASFGRPTYRDADPRVAVVWAPSSFHGDTLIRAGFGTYHQDGQLDDQNVPESNEVTSFYLSQKTIPGLAYPVTPFFTGVPGVISPSAMQRDRKDMYASQWGLSIQQALPLAMLGTLSYVGGKATHLLTLSYINVIDPSSGERPYPQFGQISWRGNESNSEYEALQASLRRNFKGGLLFSLNYTFSHEIDDGSMGSGDGDSLTPEIVACRACDRASGTFDARHVVNASVVYELPFGTDKPHLSDPGPLRAVLGSWQLTSIFTARTGFPVNILANRSASSVPDGNTNNQRPDLVPGVSLVPPPGSSSADWINLAAFKSPLPGTFGNAGRDIFRGPGLWQLDLGASKRIALTERYQLQLRAEAFNVLNRAQLGMPQSDISAGPGEFGLVTQPVNTTPVGTGTPRQIQLALRFEF